jgi:hypothetical protein
LPHFPTTSYAYYNDLVERKTQVRFSSWFVTTTHRQLEQVTLQNMLTNSVCNNRCVSTLTVLETADI